MHNKLFCAEQYIIEYLRQEGLFVEINIKGFYSPKFVTKERFGVEMSGLAPPCSRIREIYWVPYQ
jgi:hypothetical protein